MMTMMNRAIIRVEGYRAIRNVPLKKRRVPAKEKKRAYMDQTK